MMCNYSSKRKLQGLLPTTELHKSCSMLNVSFNKPFKTTVQKEFEDDLDKYLQKYTDEESN